MNTINGDKMKVPVLLKSAILFCLMSETKLNVDQGVVWECWEARSGPEKSTSILGSEMTK